MATDSALGRRRARAINRISDHFGNALTLPTVSRHGPEFLMMLRLEAIADYLEGQNLPPALEARDYSMLTNSQLRAMASERGMDLGNAKTKAEIIAVFEAVGE
jgi:hypothetical protein